MFNISKTGQNLSSVQWKPKSFRSVWAIAAASAPNGNFNGLETQALDNLNFR